MDIPRRINIHKNYRHSIWGHSKSMLRLKGGSGLTEKVALAGGVGRNIDITHSKFLCTVFSAI